MRLTVRLTPRGGRDAVDGVGAYGELRVRVSAPPVEGAANKALLRLIADELGVPASSIRIESGDASRTKRILVDGVDPAAVTRRWPGASASEPGL